MDEDYSGAEDVFRKADNTGEPRKHYRRNLLAAAGAVAVAGMVSAASFTAFSGRDVPAPAAATRVETPEKVAALVVPAPRKVKVTVERAEPRTARLDTETLAATESAQPPQPKMLSQDDARWARADAAASGSEGAPEAATPEPLRTAELRSKLEKLHSEPGEAEIADANSALEAEPATDSTFTGTIPPRDGEQPQPTVAASAGETAEPTPAGEQIAAAASDPESADPAVPEPQASASSADEARTVQVTTHVNMRAAPENEAAVLTVLPTGTDVKLIGCDMWCEIDFDGRRGWVYKSFIAGS